MAPDTLSCFVDMFFTFFRKRQLLSVLLTFCCNSKINYKNENWYNYRFHLPGFREQREPWKNVNLRSRTKYKIRSKLKRKTREGLQLTVCSSQFVFLNGHLSEEASVIDSKYIKRQECNIFTKPVPSQTSSKSSHVLLKAVLKNFANFTWKHLCWGFLLIKSQT